MNSFYSLQYPASFCDFIIADATFFKGSKKKGYHVVWSENRVGGLCLLERNNKLKWDKIYDTIFPNQNDEFSSNFNEYIPFFDTVFKGKEKLFAVDFSFEIIWNSSAEVEVIFKGESEKKVLVEENLNLSWAYCNEKRTKIHQRMFLNSEIKLFRIKAFIYNKKKGEVKLRRLKIKLFKAIDYNK